MSSLIIEDVAEKLVKTEKYCAEQNVAAAIQQAQLAHLILDEIICFLRPGIRESEVKEFALQCFISHGIERTWHTPYVRFGKHTLLTFMDKAKEDRTLQENDIAFIDIGIVKNGIEGDAGRTVVFGSNAIFSTIAGRSKMIFDDAIAFWKKNKTPPALNFMNIFMDWQKKRK